MQCDKNQIHPGQAKRPRDRATEPPIEHTASRGVDMYEECQHLTLEQCAKLKTKAQLTTKTKTECRVTKRNEKKNNLIKSFSNQNAAQRVEKNGLQPTTSSQEPTANGR